MVHLDEKDIQICADTHTSVVSCPASNLKLASGFAPINELLAAGVNVALGTDSTASNNTLDMWSEMRMLALLCKGLSLKAAAMPARTAFRVATINGARALGLEKEIGSLVPGKAADFLAVNVSGAEWQPVYDIVAQLVYVAQRSSVTDVWVAGKRLMKQGQLTTLSEKQVVEKVKKWVALVEENAEHVKNAEPET